MLTAARELILSLMDTLFGWSLDVSSDLSLVVVSVFTAVILAAVRLLASNQDLLRRCRQDRKALLRLAREAKTSGDRDKLLRLKQLRRLVAIKALKAEAKPLLVSVLPIALVGIWCFHRLACVPPRPGQAIAARSWFTADSVGDVAHLVPQQGLSSDNGWVRVVREASGKEGACGVADWSIRADASDRPYMLVFRHGSSSYGHKLPVGQRSHPAPVVFHGEQGLTQTEIEMPIIKPFGIVPGFPGFGFPPWLLGYLVLSLLMMPVAKRGMGVV
jgi:hypothetical protein